MASMRSLHPDPPPDAPALQARAIANLRFIRETIERATAFTAVPGWGTAAVGVTALAAAFVASRQRSWDGWVAVWLGEGLLSLAIAGVAMVRTARRARLPLAAGPGRKVVRGLLPPWLASVPLTLVLAQSGRLDVLPGLWLLLYGCGIVTGGAFPARVVPLLGAAATLCGSAALLTPAVWGDYWMAAGFGGLDVVFGAIIARRCGG